MAGIQLCERAGTVVAETEDTTRSLRVDPRSREKRRHALALNGGVTNAVFNAGEIAWFMRFSPDAGKTYAVIERMKVSWTVTTSFFIAVEPGRSFVLHRGNGQDDVALGGGTTAGTETAGWSKHLYGMPSFFQSQYGGDVRVHNPGALTATNINFDPNPLAMMSVSHVGTAGGNVRKTWDFCNAFGGPLILQAGDMLAWRARSTFGSSGLWSFCCEAEWHETEEVTW